MKNRFILGLISIAIIIGINFLPISEEFKGEIVKDIIEYNIDIEDNITLGDIKCRIN